MRYLASTVFSLLLALFGLSAQAGNFIDNGDGTITFPAIAANGNNPAIPSLTWMRCAMGMTWAGGTCTGTATTYNGNTAQSLTTIFAGQSDWRLPTLNEMYYGTLIVSSTLPPPKLDQTAFPNTPTGSSKTGSFWTSTQYAALPSASFIIDYFAGSDYAQDRATNLYYVRMVRNAPPVPSYTLTTTKAGTGSGTVTSSTGGINCGQTCSATLTSGTFVTLSATPASGSVFAGWSGACSGTGACSLSLSSANSVTATFNLATKTDGPYVLTVAKSGTGSGSITSSPAGIDCGQSCSASFTSSQLVTLVASPVAGSTFVGWTGACSGKTTCNVTMDAAKNVGASFNIPFTANTTVGANSIVSKINFNPSDNGKTGYIFITAWVHSSQFGSFPTKTGDQAAPDATAADSSPFVLVQLTLLGWQQVVNGQLIPYTSGVLGDALASQTILNNTDTTGLTGAEFCVGYGASAAEMISGVGGGRMISVASVADPSSPTPTNSCVVTANTDTSAAVAPLTGMWWNPNESGWGMSLTQEGSKLFIAWYTYDANGIPTWYVMSSCPLASSTCTGDIYTVTGGKPSTVAWVGTGLAVNKVGTGTLAFAADNNNGTFTYTINSVAGSKTITRQQFASGVAQPTIDYSSLWWNPAESGWGVSISQQYAMIFFTMYTYDASGKPYWYFASSCPVVGAGCTGDLYRVSGGKPPTVAWTGAALAVTKVGTVNLSFTDGSNGSMTFTIDGVNATRPITRELF